tara:strand:- start:2945 stop:3793 length:849 start_codon:yes stop_codon:yes gene_type:complete
MEEKNNLYFDFTDILNELKKKKVRFIIFTFIYFLLISLGYNYSNNIFKSYKYIQIKIDISKYSDLPTHYLNLNNLLFLNQRLKIEKKDFIKIYFEQDNHRKFYVDNSIINNDNSSSIKLFFEISQIERADESSITISIKNDNNLDMFDKSTLPKLLNFLNKGIHQEIENQILNFNNSLEILESTLITKKNFFIENKDKSDYFFDNNYVPLFLSNQKIINDYVQKGSYNIYKNISHEYKDVSKNPFKTFDKIKIIIIIFITYLTIIMISLILSIGSNLKKRNG